MTCSNIQLLSNSRKCSLGSFREASLTDVDAVRRRISTRRVTAVSPSNFCRAGIALALLFSIASAAAVVALGMNSDISASQLIVPGPIYSFNWEVSLSDPISGWDPSNAPYVWAGGFDGSNGHGRDGYAKNLEGSGNDEDDSDDDNSDGDDGEPLLFYAFAVVASIGQFYLSLLEDYPVVTKCLSAGVVAFFGDRFAQYVEWFAAGDSSSFAGADLRRQLFSAGESIFISGPMMHYAFETFEALLPIEGSEGFARTLTSIAHVAADTFMMDAFYIASMFVTSCAVEGDFQSLLPRMKVDFIPTLKATWITSGTLAPLEVLIFQYLPLSLRCLALNFTDVIWTVVTSYITYTKLRTFNNPPSPA